MDALQAIISRRSTRSYQTKMVDKELVTQVLEAGRYAPSGGNSQSTHFMVISNEKVLQELAILVEQEFAKMEVVEGMYASLKSSIERSKRGGYIFHYNAPILIVVANKKGYGNAMADSACALENMMIAANALDLGSCWINQLHWLDENKVIREYLEGLGLGEDETVTGGLSLGYPVNEKPERNALERKGNPVSYIE